MEGQAGQREARRKQRVLVIVAVAYEESVHKEDVLEMLEMRDDFDVCRPRLVRSGMEVLRGVFNASGELGD